MTSYDHQDTGPGPLPVIAPQGEFDYETVPLLQAQITPPWPTTAA